METMVRDLGFIISALQDSQRVFLSYSEYRVDSVMVWGKYVLSPAIVKASHFTTLEEAIAARTKHAEVFGDCKDVLIFKHEETITLTEAV
jgi:hypothetical protein